MIIKLEEDKNLYQLELQQQRRQAKGWHLKDCHHNSKHQGNLRHFLERCTSFYREMGHQILNSFSFFCELRTAKNVSGALCAVPYIG